MHYFLYHDTGFFVKYVCSILVNSVSISLFRVCRLNASDFTLRSYSSTEDRHLIALLISSIKFRLEDTRVWATTFRSSMREQCSMATIFSYSLFSILIFLSTSSFCLSFSSSFSFWMMVMRLSSLVSRWASSE